MIKSSKYRAKKVQHQGNCFDSKAEFARFQQLQMQQAAGLISDLKLQPAFELAPSVKVQGRKKPALRYVADFEYVQDGKRVVEDVKGMKTQAYIIKRHLMMSVHGIEILETK